MARQTTQAQRFRFYKRHIQGETYQAIGESEQISKECVRYWCRRQRDGGNCQSRYGRRAEGLLSCFGPLVRFGILRLRLEHPRWGPNRILARLKKRPSLKRQRLPSESSIGRYLHHWERFHRRAKIEVLRERPRQPERVHQRWQIDFKMEISLKDGSLVNLCNVRDPVGEACIGAFVFPAGRKKPGRRVTFPQVRSALRLCFARWNTLPDEVQTDNEALFVGQPQDPFPSQFTLWLQGLGILHLMSRSGIPTDNAEVERCHRTIHDYAVVGNEGADLAELQSILDEAVYELCFELPSRAEGCGGLTPVEAHPELLQPRRPFQPEHELAHFDLRAVDAFLATFVWHRKVGKTGQITMAGSQNRYSVGRNYARQLVLVRLDPTDRHFVFSLADEPEREIGRRPVKKINSAELTGIASWPIGLGVQQLILPLPFFQEVSFK
jgi:transposase InsO family protein